MTAFEIIDGVQIVLDVLIEFDLTQQEIEKWMDDAEAGKENALKASPKDIAEQYEAQLRDLKEAYGQAGVQVPKKVAAPSRLDRRLIEQVMAEMAADGDSVTVSQVCRWADVSRPSYYYRPTKAASRVKRIISDLPYTGYRTVAWLLGENKNTIQRLFQLKGWQVRKRRSGARPRVEALPSAASGNVYQQLAT